MYKVSVVIPVYNVGKYIGACLESVLNQTMKEVEVICIDDVSTDNSLEIIRKYAEKDSRVRVVAYEQNQSASQARKDGALMATGEYIMFLDGDDYLELDACEKLYAIIKKKKVDMVHFGTNIVNMGNVPQTRLDNLKKLLDPYQGKLKGKDVFEGCFLEKKYRFSIWNKIYESGFCKKAMACVKDGNFPKAQDLYGFLVLCYHATSYLGIQEAFYNYRFGTGITGNQVLQLNQLERYCSSVLVADAVEEFLQESAGSTYAEVAASIREDLLNDCVGNWYSYVPRKDAPKGLSILCKYWRIPEIVGLLCKKYFPQRELLAEKIAGAQVLQFPKNKKIKTIGIFYYRLTIGGIQRVISKLIPLYLEMGYDVVLFTDEIDEAMEYQADERVHRVILPPSIQMEPEDYKHRAEVFSRYLKEYQVDLMCYHATSSPMFLFDMLVMKLQQIAVVATVHEVAFQSILTLNLEVSRRPAIYRLADCVTVLSRIEELYWKTLGVHARYVSNPINVELVERDSDNIEKHAIVWVGRLDAWTKGCEDLPAIMSRVVARVPDAKLWVVGNEVTPGIQEKLEQEVEDLELHDNVIFCGGQMDVGSYYRKADIHLLTSVSDTFPMTVVESKSYGLPMVMYELPFLEMCRDPRGYISARQGDKEQIADALIRLLEDDAYREQMGKEAKQSLKDFMTFDLTQEWQIVFDEVSQEKEVEKPDENLRIMLESLLHHYKYGVMNANRTKARLTKENAKLRKKSKSLDYRLGRKLLRIPRKIKKLLRKIKRRIVG